MAAFAVADFLIPEGFVAPGRRAALREATLVTEAGRLAWAHLTARPRPMSGRARLAEPAPVILVPGFMAGDATLSALAHALRRRGHRTYGSHIRANVDCTARVTAALEARLEAISARHDGRVTLVGHSLGGLLARGLAVRRPDLVGGLVTLGSPMLAPGAHHVALTRSLETLVRLSRVGVPGLMAMECVSGECARSSFAESRRPVAPDVSFTAVYSRRDGIVDWRACIDPLATPLEVRSSHLGMVVDPVVIRAVVDAVGSPSTA